MEPGKTLLKSALQLIVKHPAFHVLMNKHPSELGFSKSAA